jgi:NAD(P)-dependent dehydrogenase (short-subunit alcohol dehydrogenase family)
MTSTSQPVAVITGASSGVGKAAAKALAQLGFYIIALGRNPERCAQAQKEIAALATHADSVQFMQCDFSQLKATTEVAKKIVAQAPRIDVLINNAGGVSSAMRITDEGLEQTFASNYLSPFVLTYLLLPTLIESAKTNPDGKARVIATSSVGHHTCPGINFDDLQWVQNYTTGGAYTNAKLGNILFTKELAKRYGDNGIIAHAMEPGVILESNFVNHAEESMKKYMAKLTEVAVSAEEAASTLVWLATDKQVLNENGGYFYQCKPAEASQAAQNEETAARLWQESIKLLEPFI